jgi:hypothetical protein
MSQLLKHMHPLMNMEVKEGPKMSYEQVVEYSGFVSDVT